VEPVKLLRLSGYPNPRQKEFFLAKARHIAYGGARGGGKSWAMRRKFVMLSLRYPGLQLLLMRRTLPELSENHLRPLQQELAGVAEYKSAQRQFLFPNGSRIRLGYCDRESDVFQYQGQEYDVVGLEEATHFTESQMQFITTCNRGTRSDFTPRMYYTCNPGGVGHAWVKRLFIDRQYRAYERPEDYAFIPAKVYDNPVLIRNSPDYVRSLENLPEQLRRAHLEGDWDVLSGQYFSEFRRDIHVCEPFEIPPWWRRFRAMDWGYHDPCAVLWFACDPEGGVVVYRELYCRYTLAGDMADRVRELSRGEKIAYTVASPDAWQRRGLGRVGEAISGQSIEETFARRGVPLIKADNTRVAGWQRVREYLSCRDGVPGLRIFPQCENLIRTLPLLQYDDKDVEDVSDYCEDHAPEALRYGLMSRPVPSVAPKEPAAAAYDPLREDVPRGSGYMAL